MNPLFIPLLKDSDTPATILNCLMLKTYGSRYYNWEPETAWLQIMQDSGIELDEFNRSKISAITTLVSSSQFYDYWEPFENICSALNDQSVHFEDMAPLSSEELVWGIIEAKLDDDSEHTFSHDVKAYINTVFKKEGISTCPDFISAWHSYASYNPYEKKQEAIKQARIKAYVVLRLKKIIRLSREYFMRDIRQDIIQELPWAGNYI